MRLEGRKALVTGGASGIGAAIARRLAAEAASVVIGDLNEEGAREVADEVGGEAVQLDVTEVASAAAVVEALGPFEVLINNAGMDEFGFFTQTDPGLWERVIAVNLMGVLACTHAVLPAMQEAGYGRIVNIASEAGRVGSKGSAVYSAAKGGVIAFTKTIAREVARSGVTANCVCPGPTRTPLLEGMAASSGDRFVDALTRAVPMRRLGEPEDIAAAVAFLASERAGYVTGQTLSVSGGLTMA
jgi:2-hydroxycyclohexanecarboxyl-CoA dehydrogenase